MYVASRAQTLDICRSAAPTFSWEAEDASSYLASALRRLRRDGHSLAFPDADPRGIPKQRVLSAAIDADRFMDLVGQTAGMERAHLKSQEAATAAWIHALPNDGLDTHLSNRDFTFAVKSRLGVEMYARDARCPFCNVVQDKIGTHALGCMAGGDCTLRHNRVRDLVFDHARNAGLTPLGEPVQLLTRPVGATEPNRRRPADVLVQRWPDVLPSGLLRGGNVALDFAVIDALGARHWTVTAESSGTAAATQYAQQKRLFDNTEEQCRSQGIAFMPVVLTAQGAVEPNGEKALETLHRAAASELSEPLAEVRRSFNQKLSVSLIRANARATRRRNPDGAIAAERGVRSETARLRQAAMACNTLALPTEDVDMSHEATAESLAEGLQEMHLGLSDETVVHRT